MKINHKVWIVLASFALVLAILACSSTSPTATPQPTPTLRPTNTLAPTATLEPTNTPVPTDTPEPPASAVGKWLDPDTRSPFTITTIEDRNGELVVVSIINAGRGVEELSWSRYENGLLSWEYCPGGMHCITSELISVTSDSLTATWAWSDGGNSGITVYQRVP
jgi:hypothetical protein